MVDRLSADNGDMKPGEGLVRSLEAINRGERGNRNDYVVFTQWSSIISNVEKRALPPLGDSDNFTT